MRDTDILGLAPFDARPDIGDARRVARCEGASATNRLGEAHEHSCWRALSIYLDLVASTKERLGRLNDLSHPRVFCDIHRCPPGTATGVDRDIVSHRIACRPCATTLLPLKKCSISSWMRVAAAFSGILDPPLRRSPSTPPEGHDSSRTGANEQVGIAQASTVAEYDAGVVHMSDIPNTSTSLAARRLTRVGGMRGLLPCDIVCEGTSPLAVHNSGQL
ncbi:hypothetical protein FIBSPDRAFT_328238 [Athelia psychrophila]|uniref:Uncharacterized protein n=1 Tax=Athelia psychrophila TaxID=1759441 RepID=A0A166QD91_9AGAM|nr:hypothetical protein FIBSPDRAFT_328238 [Fibularhizoctonia sp. CBS 109695]